MTTWILLFANLMPGQSDVAELELETRRLVRQLDGPSLAQREAAEQTLLEFGPSVLDLLPPVTRTTSAEVRVRLDRIRNRLQQQAAEQRNGVGSRFRATIYPMGTSLPENDSRPLPPIPPRNTWPGA